MPKRYVTLEDIQNTDSWESMAALLEKLGYNADVEPLDVPKPKWLSQTEAVEDVRAIAQSGDRDLQILLFELSAEAFKTSEAAIAQMGAIAEELTGPHAKFLLLATQNYDRLLLVNPRYPSDEDADNPQIITKYWFIDITNPTENDWYLLEAIAAITSDAGKLYNLQCEAFDVLDRIRQRDAGDKPHLDFPENSLDKYLQRIRQIPPLPVEEETKLSRQVARLLQWEQVREQLSKQLKRDPDDREWAEAANVSLPQLKESIRRCCIARNKMVGATLPVAVSIAKKYQNRGLELEDLIQEGCRGLIRAAERFDPTKGYRLSSYAYWWIRQAITRAIADRSRTVRLPAHIWQTTSAVKKTIIQLSQEIGRLPTKSELAARLEMIPEKLQFLIRYTQPIVSLDVPAGEEEDATLAESIEFDGALPEERVSHTLWQENLDEILETLSLREREVIRMRYGLDNGMEKTLQEIANLFNLTRERIRQIEKKAFSKLRSGHRKRVLSRQTNFSTIKPVPKERTGHKSRHREIDSPVHKHQSVPKT